MKNIDILFTESDIRIHVPVPKLNIYVPKNTFFIPPVSIFKSCANFYFAISSPKNNRHSIKLKSTRYEDTFQESCIENNKRLEQKHSNLKQGFPWSIDYSASVCLHFSVLSVNILILNVFLLLLCKL